MLFVKKCSSLLLLTPTPPSLSFPTQTLSSAQSLTAYKGQGICVGVNELRATGGQNRVSPTGVLELNGSMVMYMWELMGNISRNNI